MRDLDGIRGRAPGFQVFSPGAVVSHGTGVKIEVGVPVTVGGLEVHPGDLLHADASGVVNVPLEIAESVARRAAEVIEEEAEVFNYLVRASASLEGIRRRFGG